MLAATNRLAAKNPWTTAIVTTAAKTTLADVMTQKYLEGKREIDYRRTAVFGIFGASYQGAGQYFIWNRLMERILPISRGFSWAHRVAFVNGVLDPLFFFPTFYSVKSLLVGLPEGCSPVQCVGQGLGDYRRNYLQDWFNSWAVWIPGHCVTAQLATHLRIPWVATLSFGYCCLLSVTRGEIESRNSKALPAFTASPTSPPHQHLLAGSNIDPRRVALSHPELGDHDYEST
jgi:hypothetical protein